ncbi:MAG: hypothetical protein IKP61_07240 [Spirochaetales bacterium]|nr:hypothetical protein [Spirochaetales bacterium]
MKRIIVLLLLALLIATSAFAADVASRTFPMSSDIYGLMDDLYALEGLSRPSTSRPWSQAEAVQILSRIRVENLSEAERGIYGRIEEIIYENLRWNYEDFAVGVKIDLALEGYLHSNDTDFILDTDWLRGFEYRRPLARLSMDFSVGSLFYTYCDLQYGYGRVTLHDNFVRLNPNHTAGGYLSNDGYIGSYRMDSGAHIMVWSNQYSKKAANNILPKSEWFDFIWPKRALVSAGGDNWNIQFGRDRLEIGNSTLGNLLVDNHTDFEDYFSVTFFSSLFKYQWTNLFLNGITDNGETRTDDTRIFMIHTLEFRPTPSLSFIISEDVMFKIASDEGTAQVVDYSFFNPAFIWHNLNNRSMFNAIAYAEVNWAPFKGTEFYGQFALDQAVAPNENPDQGDAWGFVTGAKYTAPIGDGVARLYAEFAYTTPLLYRRDQVDFVKMTRYFHLTTAEQLQPDASYDSFGSNALVFEYIGFPYGGDVEALQLGCVYTLPGILKATLYGRLLQQGQFNLYVPHNKGGNNEGWPNYEGKTPSGTNWTRAIYLSSNIEMKMDSFFNWPGITLEAELDWIGKWKFNRETKEYSGKKTDTQFSIGVNISI